MIDLTPVCAPTVLARLKVLSEDVRLDEGVVAACEDELPKCGNAPVGKSRGRVLRCLWDLKGNAALSSACKTAVHRAMAAQMSDYRANSALSVACARDLQDV